MNSGAPASTAPPDFSSLGMMASHRNVSTAYCDAEKYFGVYVPAGAAAFSLCTIWWTYAAASAGITCRTEPPAAVTARVRRMSRRLMDSLAMYIPHKKRRGLKPCRYKFPFLASSRRYSEARQESAMIVSVGFLSGLVTNGAPSVTNPDKN